MNWIKSDYKQIRNIIVTYQKDTENFEKIIFIKPSDHTSFANIVQILDEMKINLVDHYTILDIDENEKIFLQKKK
ncbi:hypothetical protein [Rhizosphaericola mali]|uniref:Uncharacterized protein n=1 Tax=Rhizosphaericola mali TaxID=2545455 RepID=A0A5P2G833_9BACT|nr:hypothetical protein [Rhizosphaericola mali]QES89910.1 hypothetical protein E0W69_015000 [Rhizosphaericola mali]